MTEQPHQPHSPDEVIDPRWTRLMRTKPETPASEAGPGHHTHLGDEMRAIIEPWEDGQRTTRETLKALKDLADDAL
jgi:hypothetical protein